MLSEPIAVLFQVVDVLEALGIDYVVGGSMASALHGVSRSTLDVDLVADIHLEHVNEIVAMLSSDFYVDADMIRSALQSRGSFNLIHLPTLFKVDIFLPRTRNFDRLQLSRRIARTLSSEPERVAFLLTPEDIILAKLDWFKQGNMVSERQWRDVLGVLSTQAGSLDIAYMRECAVDLGVVELLEKALTESKYQ